MSFPVPGQIFEERYQIGSILGAGGFARVYRATELGLDRPVALKVLRPPLEIDQSDSQRDDYMSTLMKRFEREARLLSQLRSPYTIRMYQYGRSADGLLFMALEYVDGVSLAQLSKAEGRQAPDRVVRIIRQVLESLREAHAMGMMHRDMKPANIMIFDHLGVSDQVKLLDFGIAKTVNDTGRAELTGDGTLIGTPRYMAPEQINGSPADITPSADIYALGLVAYELLVGEKAVQGDNSIQIIGNQLTPESFSLPELLPLSPKLREIINRMMAKSRGIRYATVEEVLADLGDPEVLNAQAVFADVPTIQPADILPLDDRTIPGDVLFLESGVTPTVPADSNKIPMSLWGVIAATLLLISLVAAWMLKPPKEIPTPEKSEVVASDTGTGSTSEALVEQTDLSEDQPSGVKPAEAAVTPTLVASNMQGVEIFVDGDLAGTAPIEIKPDQLPAVVTARVGTFEKEATLHDRRPALVIEFDLEEVAARVETEAEPVVKPTPSRPTPKKSKRPSSKSRPTKKSSEADELKYYLE